jgi:hypothetical protein
MFDNDEDGGKWIPSNGLWRIDFTIRYKMKKRRRISLVLDYNTLQNAAFANGLKKRVNS